MLDLSTMSSKGQVVVPKRVRQALQADAGSYIAFELKGDKAVMFVVRGKSAKAAAGYGLVKGKGRKVALKDWDAVDGYERGLDFADALHLAASGECDDLATFDSRGFARRATRLRRKPAVVVPGG